jgi:hypothetical protein
MFDNLSWKGWIEGLQALISLDMCLDLHPSNKNINFYRSVERSSQGKQKPWSLSWVPPILSNLDHAKTIIHPITDTLKSWKKIEVRMVLGMSFAITQSSCHGVGSCIESLKLSHTEFRWVYFGAFKSVTTIIWYSINLMIAPLLGIVSHGFSMIYLIVKICLNVLH